MINKTLVFHIYAYDNMDYVNNIAYRFHMKCLEMYSHLFNKACFNISVDNLQNKELIRKIKIDIINCGFKNVEIIVTRNDYYCEVNTFKHFILDRLNIENDLVFFGHTKGIINVIDNINYIENILHWVYTMYYFNLDDFYINDMQDCLIRSKGGKQKTFYGTLRTYVDVINSSFYPGSFYWINRMKLYEDSISNNIRIPNYYNRNFCEELPYIYKNENDKFNGLSSYLDIGINEYLYNDNDWDIISNKLSNGNNEDYIKTYNKIINEINER